MTKCSLADTIDIETQYQLERGIMKNVRDVFVGFLKAKKLKLTRQREVILNAFSKTGRHLSADDLYDIVRKKDPGIGHATVFRTLKLLCEANIAKEVDLGDKRLRYEPKLGDDHHDHLVCLKCGSLIEAVDQEIERLQKKLCKKFDFQPIRYRMEIFGLCKKCRK